MQTLSSRVSLQSGREASGRFSYCVSFPHNGDTKSGGVIGPRRFRGSGGTKDRAGVVDVSPDAFSSRHRPLCVASPARRTRPRPSPSRALSSAKSSPARRRSIPCAECSVYHRPTHKCLVVRGHLSHRCHSVRLPHNAARHAATVEL